jgi:hypothetical protein
MRDFKSELLHHFGYLESECGYKLVSFLDQPRAFDNFEAMYSKPPISLRVTRDRSQVFVELRHGDSPWVYKEPLLERLGVSMSRLPTYKLEQYGGLWSGYDIQNQSADLKMHLGLLERHIESTAQPGAQADGPASGRTAA